jgi:hypothetical protein
MQDELRKVDILDINFGLFKFIHTLMEPYPHYTKI